MAAPHGFIERLAELSAGGEPFVSVTLAAVVGSAPQDAGSKMLVTAAGRDFGTVGGGRVELKAIQAAQAMLARPAESAQLASTSLVQWNLQRDVGMTCGGVVTLLFETYNYNDWKVVIFGAGHVASAVVRCLAALDCRMTVIDSRADWLAQLPDSPRLLKRLVAEPCTLADDLPSDAFVVCMTMGHRTDLPILAALLRRPGRFPYLGVIGSRAKRAVLLRELGELGIDSDACESFVCPIGLNVGSNQPGEIAVSVVAQLLQRRDSWRAQRAPDA